MPIKTSLKSQAPNSAPHADAEPHPIMWTPRPNAGCFSSEIDSYRIALEVDGYLMSRPENVSTKSDEDQTLASVASLPCSRRSTRTLVVTNSPSACGPVRSRGHASGTEVCLPMNSSEEQKGMTR